MASATTDQMTSVKTVHSIDLPTKAATKIPAGCMVDTDASGWATNAPLGIRTWGVSTRAADNTVTGAAPTVNVRLSHPIEVRLFANDTGSPLTKADVGHACYVLYNTTLTGDSSSGNAGPIVYEVTTEGVWAFFLPSTSGAAETIALADVAAIYTATDVEAALAEVKVLADAGMPVLKKTVTVAESDLVAAATTQTINIGTALPANARIVGFSVHDVTAFTGGGSSALKLDIGTSGDVDAIVAQADLFAAPVDGQASTLPFGIAPHKLFATVGAQLTAKFTSTGGNVTVFTAGSCIIDVLYTVLA